MTHGGIDLSQAKEAGVGAVAKLFGAEDLHAMMESGPAKAPIEALKPDFFKSKETTRESKFGKDRGNDREMSLSL